MKSGAECAGAGGPGAEGQGAGGVGAGDPKAKGLGAEGQGEGDQNYLSMVFLEASSGWLIPQVQLC